MCVVLFYCCFIYLFIFFNRNKGLTQSHHLWKHSQDSLINSHEKALGTLSFIFLESLIMLYIDFCNFFFFAALHENVSHVLTFFFSTQENTTNLMYECPRTILFFIYFLYILYNGFVRVLFFRCSDSEVTYTDFVMTKKDSRRGMNNGCILVVVKHIQ